MAEGLRLRIIRDFAGIEEIREVWSAWHSHPNSDIDFYLTILLSMPGVSPYVVVLYRGEEPEALLIGRLEKGRIDLKFGYKTLLRPKARILTFIYKGLLGDASPENTKALVQEVIDALKRNEADAAMLGHVRTETPLSALGLTMPGFCAAITARPPPCTGPWPCPEAWTRCTRAFPRNRGPACGRN